MLTVLLLIIVCFLAACLLFRDLARPTNFPPGPRGLPLVGNTPLLRKLARSLGGQHEAFSQLAAEFKTPVVGLKLGSQLVAVALTPSVVREVLTKDEYVGRPDSFFMRLRCFGSRRGITFADGELWHEQRGFTLRTLRDLGMGKPRMEALVMDQLHDLIQQFREGSGGLRPIDILSPCIIRVLWEVVAGQRLSHQHPQLLRLIHILGLRNRAFDMAGGVLSQFPWIRHVAPRWSGYQLLTSLNAEMRAFLMETVEEHRATYKAGETRDLIDAFLHELHAPKTEANSFTEEQLLMVLVDLFLGGATSTTATLDFALLLMLAFPDVQEKVFQETLQVVGPDRLPTTADRIRLPYTEAVLLEAQRLCTVIPITGPRRVLKDTTLHGYFLPKDTTVLISQWSVHRDSAIYSNPSEFHPERFLDPHTRSTSLENLIPFGLGKRRCIGESLAKPCLFLIFSGIVHTFKLQVPDSDVFPCLDPTPGIILTPKPYTAIFTPRKS